jgi:hypothetical protein
LHLGSGLSSLAAVLWVKEDKIYGAKDPETAGDS